MIVEDVFSIWNKGVVAVGTVLRNSICVNDTLIIMSSSKFVRVTGIEVFRKTIDVAETGMNVALLLEGITRDELMASDKLLKM